MAQVHSGTHTQPAYFNLATLTVLLKTNKCPILGTSLSYPAKFLTCFWHSRPGGNESWSYLEWWSLKFPVVGDLEPVSWCLRQEPVWVAVRLGRVRCNDPYFKHSRQVKDGGIQWFVTTLFHTIIIICCSRLSMLNSKLQRIPLILK